MKLQQSNETDFSIDLDEVLPLLEKSKKSGRNQYVAICPAHDDHRQSLSIGTTPDGKALLYCHASCSYLDIIQALGLYKEPSTPAKREIVAEYDYVDESGELLFQTLRFHPKNFGQRRPDGNNGWIYNLKGTRKVLYRLPELINSTDDYVFVIEGEKAVDAVRERGYTATTNPLGGAKWSKDFNKYFKGKNVLIFSDADETGAKHSEVVSKNVFPVANSVRIIELDGLKEHEGLDDWIARTPDYKEKLEKLITNTEQISYDEDELEIDDSAPSYLEGEYSILGAIFVDNKLITKVIDAESVNDFYHSKTKAVLKAILSCYDNKQGLDIVTVGEKLKQQRKLDIVGGLKFLKELKNDVPDTLNIDSWVAIVKAKADFRRYIKLSAELGKVAQQELNSPEGLGEELQAELAKIRNKGGRKESFVQIGEPIYKIIEEVKNLDGSSVTGLSTGFVDVDDATGGLINSDLIIVAGRSSQGKTSYALNVAYNVAQKENVLFFSMEMSREQLIRRVMCSEARVNATNFRTGNLDKNDWARLASVIPKLEETKLFINETPSLSVPSIRNEAYKFTDQHPEGFGLIVIDYLTLMKQLKSENRFQEVSEIARELKGLAKELNRPIVALSQLSRAVEQRNPPIPMMSDLRQSGELEEAADVIQFLYRPEYYNPLDESLKGLAQLIVGKSRNGATGTIDLAWLAQYTRFENLFPFETHLKIGND